jgi:hypothetical protein
MNEQPEHEPTPRLQFDFASDSATGSSGPACAACQRSLDRNYFECNGVHVCEVCKVRAEEDFRKDSGWNRMPTALLFGFGAALAGSILYYLFIKVLNIELGLMAIGVGWLVGKAVMRGSNFRGGRKYQILAIALTYFSITFSYIPLMIEASSKARKTAAAKTGNQPSSTSAPARAAGEPAPSQRPRMSPGRIALGLGFLLLIVLAAPFLAGFGNFLGWIIIAIGLWEAWKFTRAVPFATSGPYELKAAGGNEAPAAS